MGGITSLQKKKETNEHHVFTLDSFRCCCCGGGGGGDDGGERRCYCCYLDLACAFFCA